MEPMGSLGFGALDALRYLQSVPEPNHESIDLAGHVLTMISCIQLHGI